MHILFLLCFHDVKLTILEKTFFQGNDPAILNYDSFIWSPSVLNQFINLSSSSLFKYRLQDCVLICSTLSYPCESLYLHVNQKKEIMCRFMHCQILGLLIHWTTIVSCRTTNSYLVSPYTSSHDLAHHLLM